MRCTVKKTLTAIVESGNEACIGLKANQKTLLQQAQHCAETQVALSRHYEVLDTTHGRCVERCVEVFAAPAALAQTWPEVVAFVAVERCGWRDKSCFQHRSWFILTRVLSATEAAHLIREHRGAIENRLHWVKDVVYQEDHSLIRTARPAALMALFRTWALSAFRKAGQDSLTQAIRRFQHDIPKLLSFL
ncbi:MAG: ISAs1 family transposase [Gammaproteobacteria bacterium]|nr:MAG: ISAs1 family transposase [Gammaproteobacteria bacterium]